MSKGLAKVALIAGAVALIATGVGAAAGAGLLGVGAMGAAGTVAGIGVGTIATVATVATVVAGVASIASQATAKTPPMTGQINRLTIAKEAAAACLLGLTFFGGILRHDAGYGAELKKVPNPYRGMVVEYGVGGPYQSLESMSADFNPLTFSAGAETGYYAGFMWRDYKLGLTSETALTPHFSGFPNWTSDHKLSGKASALWNLLFDKDGKRFAGGVPALGAVWKGAKVYDPRLDSTYPGGSGACRITNEATWVWSECPGLHGLTYAYGRYLAGKLVFGAGMPATGIRIADFVTLANVCDANGWKVGGPIFEPGDTWANLKDILAAGGAEPLFNGAMLGCKVNAPHVALDTLTDADLADDDAEIAAAQTWRDRPNGIFPKYRSEAHRWEYVTTDLVTASAYFTADGEEKKEERQWNLVQDATQVSQLAAYDLANGRELGPITLVCKPRMRRYGPGDMLTLDLPDHGLAGIDAIIQKRSIDPGSMTVTLTLMSETTAKHAFALGLTGTPPPTPGLTDTETRDDIAEALRNTALHLSASEEMFVIRRRPEDLSLVEGQLPLNRQLKLMRGAVDVTADATWTLAVNNGGANVASVGTTGSGTAGLLTVTEFASLFNGYLIVRANYAGIDNDFTLSFDTQFDPGDSSLPYARTHTPLGQDVVSSGSYADIGGIMTATAGAGGEIRFNTLWGAQANDAGTFAAWFDLLIRPATGGAWTSATGANFATVSFDPVNRQERLGGVGFISGITGLTPTDDYELQWQVKKNSGSASSGRVRSLCVFSYGI